MGMPLPSAFHHTAFLVRDLEASAERMADALGIGPWEVRTIVPEWSRVRGREQAFSFRVAVCAVGGAAYELVAPHTGRSVVDEELERRGEGFHHSCLFYPTLAELRAARAELLRQGRIAVQEAGIGTALEFVYFDFPELGSLVELLYLDGSQLGPPDRVIVPRG